MALGSLCTVFVGPPVLNADEKSFIFQVGCAQICNKRSGVGGFSLIYFFMSCDVTHQHLPEALVLESHDLIQRLPIRRLSLSEERFLKVAGKCKLL